MVGFERGLGKVREILVEFVVRISGTICGRLVLGLNWEVAKRLGLELQEELVEGRC